MSAGFSILPALVGFFKFKSAGITFRLIIFYFILCLIVEYSSIIMSFYKVNNNLMADFFYLAEGLILIAFFYRIINEKEFYFPAIFLSFSYMIYGMYTTFIDPGPASYNSNFRTGESLILQAISAYSLIKISKKEDIQLTKDSTFWIASGIFIYFSVNLVIFFTATFLFEDKIYTMSKTWIIHSIINIIANIIFTFGLLCLPSVQRK